MKKVMLGLLVAAFVVSFQGLPLQATTLFLEEFEGTVDGGDVSNAVTTGNLTNDWTKVANAALTYSHVLVDSGWSAVGNSAYGFIDYYDNTDVLSASGYSQVELTAVIFDPRDTVWTDTHVSLHMGADFSQAANNSVDQVNIMVMVKPPHETEPNEQFVKFIAQDGDGGGTIDTGWISVGLVTHPARIQKFYDVRILADETTSEFFWREHGAVPWNLLGTLDGLSVSPERITFTMYGTDGCMALDTVRIEGIPEPATLGLLVLGGMAAMLGRLKRRR